MNSRLLKRVLSIGTILLVVVALVVGVALPGLAADNPPNTQPSSVPTKILKGKVVSKAADKTSFSIQNGENVPVLIKADANTKYFKITGPLAFPAAVRPQVAPSTTPKVPPQQSNMPQGVREKLEAKFKEKLQNSPVKPVTPNKDVERGIGPKQGAQGLPDITEEMLNALENQVVGEQAQTGAAQALRNRINWLRQQAQKATFDDIAVGDRVITKVMPNENLAKIVLIIKQSKSRRVSGTITAITSDSITITPTAGTPVILGWNENTRFVLQGLIAVQAGQIATAAYNVDTLKASNVTVKKPVPTPAPTSTAPTS